MFYASYAMNSFEDALRRSQPTGRELYALVLFRDMDKHIIDFITTQYESLNSDSRNALHIIAPIRPPGSEAWQPLNPISQRPGERDDFYQTLHNSGMDLKKLPAVLLFQVEKKKDGDLTVKVLGLVSLRSWEEKEDPKQNYHTFFRRLLTEADDARLNNKTPEEAEWQLQKKLAIVAVRRAVVTLFKKLNIRANVSIGGAGGHPAR